MPRLPSEPTLRLNTIVYGAHLGIVDAVQRALVPEYSARELRGSAYGIYYLT